jgi:hypothetical protein
VPIAEVCALFDLRQGAIETFQTCPAFGTRALIAFAQAEYEICPLGDVRLRALMASISLKRVRSGKSATILVVGA